MSELAAAQGVDRRARRARRARTASTSASDAARSSRCSAATAPARRRCCARSAGLIDPTQGTVRTPARRRVRAPGPELAAVLADRPARGEPDAARCSAGATTARSTMARSASASSTSPTGIRAASPAASGSASRSPPSRSAAREVLLLDEPTRGMDAASRRALEHAVRDHAAGGGGVVLATHDVELAARCATRRRRARRRRRRRRRAGRRRCSPARCSRRRCCGVLPPFLTVAEVERALAGERRVTERVRRRARLRARPVLGARRVPLSVLAAVELVRRGGSRRRRAAVGRGRRRARGRRARARGPARDDERRDGRDPRRAVGDRRAAAPRRSAGQQRRHLLPGGPGRRRVRPALRAAARDHRDGGVGVHHRRASARGCRSRCSASAGWARAPGTSVRSTARLGPARSRSSSSPRTAGLGLPLRRDPEPVVVAVPPRRGRHALAARPRLRRDGPALLVVLRRDVVGVGRRGRAVQRPAHPRDRARAAAHPPPLRPPPRARGRLS